MIVSAGREAWPASLDRDRILDAAVQLILERGVRRASTAELARRFGVVQSALSHHFPGGKRELIEAALDREEARGLADVERAVAASRGARGRLLAFAKAKIGHVVAIARLYPVNESVADEIEAYLFERRHRYQRRERELLGRIVREGRQRGELRDVDVEMAVLAVEGGLHQVVREFALRPGRRCEGVLERLVEVFFRGMGGAPASAHRAAVRRRAGEPAGSDVQPREGMAHHGSQRSRATGRQRS